MYFLCGLAPSSQTAWPSLIPHGQQSLLGKCLGIAPMDLTNSKKLSNSDIILPLPLPLLFFFQSDMIFDGKAEVYQSGVPLYEQASSLTHKYQTSLKSLGVCHLKGF